MKKRYQILLIIAIVLVLAFISTLGNSNEEDSESEITVLHTIEEESPLFLVTRVIDGDTIVIDTGEKIRLICIDTPETGEEGFFEAKIYLTKLLTGKRVYLESDITDKDRYGRLLRYVYLGNLFVNQEIVLNGYGKTYIYEPDIKHCPKIKLAEVEAKIKRLGIWS